MIQGDKERDTLEVFYLLKNVKYRLSSNDLRFICLLLRRLFLEPFDAFCGSVPFLDVKNPRQ